MAESVNYDIPTAGYGQTISTTCWFACYRMLFKHKNKDQNQILPKLTEAGLNVNELGKRGLYESEMPTAGKALRMAGWSGNWIRDSEVGMIVHLLQFYGPLWCATENYQPGFNKHAVVCVGYKSKENTLKVYNPYSKSEPGSVDVDWWTPKDFLKKILGVRWAVQAWE